MQKILAVIFVCCAVWPQVAKAKEIHYITCEMVRAYVATVGLTRARAVALAHGITPAEERKARRCLE